MNAINTTNSERGQIDLRAVIAIGAVVIVIAVGIWLLLQEPTPEPVPAPSPERPIETVEPAESPAERGDSAREVIEELESNAEGVDYALAYERGREFLAEGRNADAQLLYFFAARGGHAPAAFDLATFYDPVRFVADRSLADEPDPFQAYRWYRRAADAGHDAAAERLAELRAWAAQAAEDGNLDAERLLLQWED